MSSGTKKNYVKEVETNKLASYLNANWYGLLVTTH